MYDFAYRSLYQIHLARYYQADACLLMLPVLDDEQYRQLSAAALISLKMGVTEVSNDEERDARDSVRRKWYQQRDLRDSSIDLNRTPPAAKTGLLFTA